MCAAKGSDTCNFLANYGSLKHLLSVLYYDIVEFLKSKILKFILIFFVLSEKIANFAST